MRQLCFSLLPDGSDQSVDASPGVPPRPRRYRKAAACSPRVAETLTADQDVRTRLRACGPDALTPVEALTVLLADLPALALALAGRKLHRVALRRRVISLPTSLVFARGKGDESGT